MSLPAPKSPWAWSVVYSTVKQFSFGFGLLQIFILALRSVYSSSLNKIAETGSNLVFLFGTSYIVYMFLNEATTVNTWFAFWAGIIILTGVTFIVRAFILLARK